MQCLITNQAMNFDQNEQEKQEDLYSVSVRAGKRTYFFDVKSTRNNELYVSISESIKKIRDDGTFFYQKHKIFLFQEDFDKFQDGLNQATEFVIKRNGPLPEREKYESTSEEPNGNRVSNFTDINFEDLGNS